MLELLHYHNLRDEAHSHLKTHVTYRLLSLQTYMDAEKEAEDYVRIFTTDSQLIDKSPSFTNLLTRNA